MILATDEDTKVKDPPPPENFQRYSQSFCDLLSNLFR